MRDTWPLLKTTDFPVITRNTLEILQVNLGYLCNQSCLHCHVAAGPYPQGVNGSGKYPLHTRSVKSTNDAHTGSDRWRT